jgi:hypothetical protein
LPVTTSGDETFDVEARDSGNPDRPVKVNISAPFRAETK